MVTCGSQHDVRDQVINTPQTVLTIIIIIWIAATLPPNIEVEGSFQDDHL